MVLCFSDPSYCRCGIVRSSIARLATFADSSLHCRATVIFPPQLRISSLVPVSMEALQKLATEHQLPAVNLAPIPSGQLSDAIRNDLLSVGSNEDLYSMFAKSMDQRKTVSPSLPDSCCVFEILRLTCIDHSAA